jgi:hypothetical protein
MLALMADRIYCPYTDTEIERSRSNNEHIIPLSLGGSNSFVLPVSSTFNSEAGSDIDGDLANDFLVLFRRRHFGARGHSNKRPIVQSKHSKMEDGARPVQVEFSGEDGLRVFDPVLRRDLSEEEIAGQKFSSKFTLSRYGRLKFAAKVVLAGGYYVFGDWFRRNVHHGEVRALMNFNRDSDKQDFEGFGLKVIDEFTPPEGKDVEQLAVEKFFCQIVAGSCVYFIPGPVNIGITVGVLGQHAATLNVPANTEAFPFSDENDLGHAVLIENGQMTRMSYRQLAKKAYRHLSIKS